MQREPEPELMDLQHEVDAYAGANFRDVNTRFVERVLELVPADAGAVRVVDIGCGPGEISIAIAQACPEWEIIAVDGSSPMLQVAAKRAAHELIRNLRFCIADAKRLPEELGRFDLILSNSLLHHLHDPSGLWRSIQRLADAGANVLIRDLIRPDSALDARLIVQTYAAAESEVLQEEFYRSLLAAFTVEEVREQLARAGLDRTFTVEAVSDRHLDVRGVIVHPD